MSLITDDSVSTYGHNRVTATSITWARSLKYDARDTASVIHTLIGGVDNGVDG